jgi:Mesyanzhinovviridae DNA helicase
MRSRLVLRCKDINMIAVEMKFGRGTPDVNYIEGWIELKWLRGWPVKEGPVAISHYTNHQRLWLKRRWEKGGKSFLLLQVKKEWLIFAGCDAPPVGTLTREELLSIALMHWQRDLHVQEFKQLITSDRAHLDHIREHLGICNSPLVKNFSFNAAGAARRSTKQRRASESRTIDTSTGNVVIPSQSIRWDLALDSDD